MLSTLEESRKENVIYYISKKVLDFEEKYSPLEKNMCSTCIGNLKTQTLHACFQGLINCKNGSFEISDGEACARWEDS